MSNDTDALEDYLNSNLIQDVSENPVAYWSPLLDHRDPERAALARMAIDYLSVPGKCSV